MRAVRLVASCLLLAAPTVAAADNGLPTGFVRLRAIAPEIAQDIRYATPFNFTGAPVPGYARAECVLTHEAAAALVRVEARLKAQGYGLKLFDCYRPARAVRAFLDWGKAKAPAALASTFHPDVPRGELVSRGFIGAMSSHSRGSTVDVGLIGTGEPALPTPSEGGRCDGAFAQRPAESSLDLGTSFDCFSEKSAGAYPDLGAEVRRHRDALREAMRHEGFRGYGKEWWHFTLAKEPFPKTLFDFPIE
jgi:D-alanyl-D-alanine dipeptidase